jgi:hypothetical protein
VKRLLALCSVGLLAAARDDGAQGPTPEPPGAAAPAEALEAVALAFNQRDVKVLASALGENFVFYFDPRDVGQSPPGRHYVIPESWSYTEFWQALNNMFDQAYSINLSIPTGRVGTPGENETTYRADNVTLSLLVMVDDLNGFIVNTGYCNFEFERYESAGGKKYWRLTGWWDRTSGGYDEYPGVAPTSLGRVLAFFR